MKGKYQSATLQALCEGNPPVTGGFPSQMASDVASVYMSWCYHNKLSLIKSFPLDKMAAILADNIFKCIFLNEETLILIKISLKFVLKGPINKNSSTGSDNGLAPTRRQAIIWTNVDPVHKHIYVSLGEDELRHNPI